MSGTDRFPNSTTAADALLAKALRLLGKRDYAEKELRQKLAAAAPSESEVDAVLAQLRNAGFLDESRFAARKAQDAVGRRTVGKRRVMQELRERELGESTIGEAVEAAYEGISETDLALRHLETRLSALCAGNGLDDPRNLQRAYGRLRRAGFAHASIVTALRKHSRRNDLLDDCAPADDE